MDKHTIARISKSGERFEILVQPDRALDFKLGKESDIANILIVDTVFTNSSKGLRASTEKLQEIFNTIDVLDISHIILRDGELQLTAEQRRKLVDEKRKQIISFISRNCIDPRTGFPHPPLRVEQAMGQVRFIIDPFKSGEEQARAFIDELRPILPLKFEKLRLAIKIPPEYAAKAIGCVKEYCDIERNEWQSDGSWIGILGLPAGLHATFLERIGKITKGNYQTKIL
ncbi:MAG: ribosome assembly factor SBDS [Candidatus Hermodarchaeia archaeon]|jgi:ribosome maturation protein SDO1